MKDIADYMAAVARYCEHVDEAAVEGIVNYLGIALGRRDGALVRCDDPGELVNIRERWLRRRLQVSGSDATLDGVIARVCERMEGEHERSRVVFYYLLADHFSKLAIL